MEKEWNIEKWSREELIQSLHKLGDDYSEINDYKNHNLHMLSKLHHKSSTLKDKTTCARVLYLVYSLEKERMQIIDDMADISEQIKLYDEENSSRRVLPKQMILVNKKLK